MSRFRWVNGLCLTHRQSSVIGVGGVRSRRGSSGRRRILLVDGETNDVGTLQHVVDSSEVDADLEIVDGQHEALAYVWEVLDGSIHPPDLILLDPSIPTDDARAVVDAFKTEPRLARVPIVVVSRTLTDSEVLEFYRCHANAYLQPPADRSDFEAAVRTLTRFWLGTVRLPGQGY